MEASGSSPAVDVAALEAALTDITGVEAAVVLTDATGDVEEIQAFVAPDRDVRTVREMIVELLRSELPSDRYLPRIYTFALLDEEELPDEAQVAVTGATSRDRTGRSRVRLDDVVLDREAEHTRVEVTVSRDGVEQTGVAVGRGVDPPLIVASRATLDGVLALEAPTAPRLEVAGAAHARVLGREAVCVVVMEALQGDVDHVGTALTRGRTLEEAAARATLDAINRRLASPTAT